MKSKLKILIYSYNLINNHPYFSYKQAFYGQVNPLNSYRKSLHWPPRVIYFMSHERIINVCLKIQNDSFKKNLKVELL